MTNQLLDEAPVQVHYHHAFPFSLQYDKSPDVYVIFSHVLFPFLFLDLSDENSPYHYCASLPAAQTFTILYALAAIAHLTQAIHYRKRFCWVIIMASIWETASFALRWLSLYDIDPPSLSEYSQILVMLAPLWINAFCYMILGRVVLYFIPEQRVWGVSARRLSLIFVLLDVLCVFSPL